MEFVLEVGSTIFASTMVTMAHNRALVILMTCHYLGSALLVETRHGHVIFVCLREATQYETHDCNQPLWRACARTECLALVRDETRTNAIVDVGVVCVGGADG
jgi:hypothetical protein